MGKNKHPHNKLTAAVIRNAKPGRHPDGNCLYLDVDDNGAKHWLLRVVIHGRRHDLGLGGVSLVSLANAREEAAKWRKIARDGGDPLAERRKEKVTVPTFEEAAREVHKTQAASFRNPKHAAQWLRTLEDYALPVFGKKRVDVVDSADVLKALSPIWLTKAETARRVKQRIKTVFDWAKAAQHRTGDNPTEGLTKVLPKHNREAEHRAALPYGEVPEFIRALRDASKISATVKLALELTILTSLRTAEVLYAKWNEIDFNGKMWTIPATRGNEPGMKKKREHRVPLSARCVEILQEAKELSEGDYIFPGGKTGRPLSDMAMNMAKRRMDWKGSDCDVHGFRSSFRDWAAEKTKFPREVVEAALAHKVESKTEASYFRSDLFEKRRELMKAWAAYAISTPASKVVSIRSR